MKARSFAKAVAISAASAVIITGLSAAPAMADPAATPPVTATTLVGFGSDTTQDVMNAIAAAVNAKTGRTSSAWMASYDTFAPAVLAPGSTATTVVAKPGGVAVPRANGSGEGFKLLQVAKGTLGSSAVVSGLTKTAVTVTTSQAAGQVDFARSSSGLSSPNQTGIWSYVPFAKDAVTLVTNPLDTTTTPTAGLDHTAALNGQLIKGSASDAANVASWYNIYNCIVRYVYTTSAGAYLGVGSSATPPAGTGNRATLLKPQLPAFGSGTRSYFLGQVGHTDSATLIDPANERTFCLSDTFKPSATAPVQGINEHDGTSIKTVGEGAIAAYSIPQWVSQLKAAGTAKDRRNGVVLQSIKDTALDPIAVVPATTGTGAATATNPAFPIKRIMYNVVPYGKLADSATQEYKVFNGQNSEVCQATTQIVASGFIPLLNVEEPSTTEHCGYTMYRTGTATVAAPATAFAEFAQAKAGDAVDIQVETNAEAGGALFYSSTDSYAAALNASPVAIAAGDYVGSYTATIPADAVAGTTVSYKAKFTPTDTSIFSASAQSAAVGVKVVGDYTVTLNDIPSRVAPGVAVPVTATVAAGTGGSLVGGTIYLTDGTNVLSEKYLPKRATKVDFSWTAVAGTTNLSVVFEPDNSSASLLKESAAQDVFVAAATTKATVATVSDARSTWGLKATPTTGNADNRTPYLGKIRDAATSTTAAPKIRVTMAKSGTLTPSGTVRVLLSASKTGGTNLTLLPATLAADGTVTVTLPAANKWPVTGTSGGVDRWLNIVYSGNANFFGSTTSVKISVTN